MPAIAIKGGTLLLALVFGLNLFSLGGTDIDARIFKHYGNEFYGEVNIDGKKTPIVAYVEGDKKPERLRITYKQNDKGGIAEITVDRTGTVNDPTVKEIVTEIKKYASQAKNRETIKGKCRNFINGLKVWR